LVREPGEEEGHPHLPEQRAGRVEVRLGVPTSSAAKEQAQAEMSACRLRPAADFLGRRDRLAVAGLEILTPR
jgi:hypothetical protein